MIIHREDGQRSRLVLAGCLALLSFTVACQQADTRAADESALKDLDAQWSKAAAAKDLETTVSYYADDAVLMPPNAPVAAGAAIRDFWKSMIASPGFAGGWKVTKAEVARSGDLAYLTGTYEMTENDASGKPVNDRGKYVEVWKKQADGKWKVVADMFNSDLPLPTPTATKLSAHPGKKPSAHHKKRK
jgi:uncharacterized protein (TIGR02246 family)